MVIQISDDDGLGKILLLLSYIVLQSLKKYHSLKGYDKKYPNDKKYPASWDKNSKAVEQWYSDFMKRNNKFLSLRKPQVTSLARANVCSVETGSKSFNNHRFKPNIKLWFTVPRKLQDLWSIIENKMFKTF